MILLDTSSSFYHVYTMNGDFPYLPIREEGHFFFYGIITVILYNRRSEKSIC